MHKQITVKGVTCQVWPRDVVSAQDTLAWPSCSIYLLYLEKELLSTSADTRSLMLCPEPRTEYVDMLRR